jgi:hypothetical protein
MLRRLQWVCLPLCFALLLGACAESDDDDAADDDDDDDDNDASPADDDDDNNDNDDTTPDEIEVILDGDTLVIRNSLVRVRYDLTAGRYHILEGDGQPVIRNAEAVAYSNVLIPAHVWRSSDLPYLEWGQAPVNNALGQGVQIYVKRGQADNAPTLTQRFALLEGQSGVWIDVDVQNLTDRNVTIGAIYPLFVAPPEGEFHFGGLGDQRVLTNGVVNYGDFTVPLYPAGAPALSNWSALVYSQQTGRSISLGFLTFELGQPVVYYGPAIGGGKALTLQADSEYDPAMRLAPENAMTAETLLVDFGQETPFAALELYADRLKAWLGIETWLERHPEIGVPAGWNSWSGSSSSGGYGHDINEAIIVANMDFADRELRRWGMNYFQIDDGWQVRTGDWQVNPERFPDHGGQNGIAWLMARAHGMGFLTGLWMATFNAALDAQIVQDHPDWFCDQMLAGLLGQEEITLDLSNPEVRNYLTDLMATLREWGIDWLKLDFAYRALLSQSRQWYDGDLTRGAYYRLGVETLRQALGDDVFLLNVAVVGFNLGLVDGLRLTLDTMPAWEGESDDPYSPIAIFDNQGLKPMYRDSARRYYLHGRTWINHPDLIFFRAHANPEIPPLTLNESLTFTTSIALQGGLVKVGDRLVDLSAEAVDGLRRILPPYGKAGRPLDMFEREFPEVWSLPVDDFAEPYHVIGLLNWGINRDLTVNPYEFLADDEREIAVDLANAGLDSEQSYLAFEFWTQEFLGEVSGELALDVPARTPRVVALREKLDRPQLVGTNRHVLGGAGVIYDLEWDAEAGTLTGSQEGAIGTALAPFEHQLTFYVPAGFAAQEATVTAPAGFDIVDQSFDLNGSLATLRFTVTADDAAPQHPTIDWTIQFE